jgi:GH25 family lysozyme M1 (1,4-beta-N-acetylmuramidase)
MTVRGVDCSDNQDATLPWTQWYAGGGRVAVLRATLGFYDDTHFLRYVAEAYIAGFIVAAYHVIFPNSQYNVIKQAHDFLERLNDKVSFIALDLEVPGVSDADVLTWVLYTVPRMGNRKLVLYGNWDLARVVLAHMNELGQFGIWWAGYPTYPNPCLNPPWPRPRNVPAALVPKVIAWQFAGDNGRFPPYTDRIDLTDWYEVPSGGTIPPPPPPADTDSALREAIHIHASAIKGLAI